MKENKRVKLNNSIALRQNATHETVVWIWKREILRPRDREKKQPDKSITKVQESEK